MFADVVLPLSISGDTFTYAVPSAMEPEIQAGCRVIVSFGQRKFYTAVVVKLHHDKPADFDVKEIHSLVDAFPIVTERQLSLWNWISFYYMASSGDVMNAALPALLKLESKTEVSYNPNFSRWDTLTPTEKEIAECVRQFLSLPIQQLGKSLSIKNILPHIYALISKNAVTINEAINDKFSAKTERYIRINPAFSEEQIFSLIGKAHKQRELFENLSRMLSESGAGALSRKELLDNFKISATLLNGLMEKSILHQFYKEVSRLNDGYLPERESFALNAFQQEAFEAVRASFEQKPVCLLHGVTSSGKTEIYIHLIQQMLREGQQVLYLVPEIALTTQLMHRLKSVFGDKLGVYHSKINDSERAEIWMKMVSDTPYDVIIGVRSSLFLPFNRLGLIVVDEEHETSYKQQDSSPRYHARDTAVMLAHLSGAKTLLGSATPSFESYYNAQTGKYGYVALSQRYEELEMPEIRIENTSELRRKRKMKNLFSPVLEENIRKALELGEQVILFRNRRGFAPVLECKSCGWVPKCSRCDVSLTYHKFRNGLVCHYCDTFYPMPRECPVCHEKEIVPLGQGTEKIEEQAAELFPGTAIARLDADTARSKESYAKIIGALEKNKVQMLIGTQMLAKGLDFENVSVVGVISADSLLNRPDFRAYERGFQTMVQVSGRAGRKNKRGKVIIQSADSTQPVYEYVLQNDYHGFFVSQMQERKLFRYPPFYRLISITLKHKDENVVDRISEMFAKQLRLSLKERVLGPVKPIVSRIKLLHIRTILLKIETGMPSHKVRETILDAERRIRQNNEAKYIQIAYDVDPM